MFGFKMFTVVIMWSLWASVTSTGISSKLDFGGVAEKRSGSNPPVHHHGPRSSDGIVSQRRHFNVQHPKPTASSTIEIVNKISIKDNSDEIKTIKCESCENTASQVVITGKTDEKVDIKITLDSASQKTTEKTTEVNAEEVSDDDEIPVYVGLNGVNNPSTYTFTPKIQPVYSHRRAFAPQPSFKPLHYLHPSTKIDGPTINGGSYDKPRNTQYFEYRLGDWVPCSCGWQQASWNGDETPKLPAGTGPNFGSSYNPSFEGTNFGSGSPSFVGQNRPSIDSLSRSDGWNRRHAWHTTERMIIDDKLQPPFSNNYKGRY